ncbi:protein prune homolog 2-like [Glandiceps talaboti]
MGESHEEDEFSIESTQNQLGDPLDTKTTPMCELQAQDCDNEDCPNDLHKKGGEESEKFLDVDGIIREITTAYDEESDEIGEFTTIDTDYEDEIWKNQVSADAGGESMSSASEADSWSDYECKDEFDWDDYIPLSTLSDDTDALQMVFDEAREDDEHYQTVKLGEKLYHVDLNVVKQYTGIVSYGGTLGPNDKTALFSISGHDLPQRRKKSPHYMYTVENLFLHAIITVDILATSGYVLVYFCGRSRKTLPPLWWLKKMYAVLDRKLRKNVCSIYVVHPSFWMKAALKVIQPFVSSKLTRKIKMINSLEELSQKIPTEFMYVPDEAKTLDSEMKKRSGTTTANSSS